MRLSVLSLSLLLGATGCASLPAGKREPRDPFERTNRAIYTFNDHLDRAVLRPVAVAYTRAVPHLVRKHVRNVLDNLNYSRTIINDFLQGRGDDGASDAARFVVNTVLGVGGLFDPASRMGLDKHDHDFGETLGRWGVPSGPYIVLPFLGPSDVRDGIGLVPDAYSVPGAYYRSPKHAYLGITYAYMGVWTLDKIDLRAQLLSTDKVLRSAYDPYALMRSAYLQRRDYLVHGSSLKDDFPDLPDDTPDMAPPAKAPATPPAAAPAPH